MKRYLSQLKDFLIFSFNKFLYFFPNIKLRHLSLFFKIFLKLLFFQSPKKFKNSSFLSLSINHTNTLFRDMARRKANELNEVVKFSIVAPIFQTNIKYLNEMIDSIEAQIYNNWELILVDDFSNDKLLYQEIEKRVKKNTKIKFFKLKKKATIGFCTNFGIKKCDGNYIGLIDHDDTIDPNTLLLAAIELNKNPNLALLYTDEDKFNGKHYFDFQYKTDFDRQLLLTSNYINHFKIFETKLARNTLLDNKISGVQDIEFLHRYISQIDDSQVCHIPVICYHWRSHNKSISKSIKNKKYMLDQAKEIFQKNLNRLGYNAKVFLPKFAKENNLIYFNLKWHKAHSRKVSFIIPNKNNYKMLQNCINSLKQTVSDFSEHQIIIVDDNSDDQQTLEYYNELTKNKNIQCEVFHVNFGEFNFSKMINFGVNRAKNEFLLILNNDVTAIQEGWLDQMKGWFNINNVGIVGPKLLFPNGKIQHAGVIVGSHHGLADHYFYNLNKNSNTYLNQLNLQRNVSAVTGACFLTKKSVFKKVRGMDDDLFKVSYSDIDFCLRVKEKNFKIIYDNTVELFHLTSASRGSSVNPVEHHNFVSKYKKYRDPYVNPNIDINSTSLNIDFDKFTFGEYLGENLHLALFTHNLELGGAQLLILDYAKEFVKLGFKVTIISTKNGPLENEFKKLEKTNVLVLEMDVVSPCNDLGSSIKSYFESLDNFFKRNKPDFIFANTMLSFPAVIYSNSRSIHSRWFIHEEYSYSEMYANFNGNQGVKLIDQAFEAASTVVFESTQIFNCYNNYYKIKNYVIRPGGINYSEIEKFKNNFHHNEKTKLKEKLNLPINNKIFLNVGTVCERKNQIEIVKAIAKMPEHFRKLFSVLIVGDIGLDYSKTIKHFITKNKLTNVLLLTNKNNIYDYYSMADFYVSTTKSESFPRSLLTAMAFELPIISSIYPGVEEILYDDNYANFYKKNDIESLSNNIVKFLDNNYSQNNQKTGLSLSLVMRIFNIDRVMKHEINSIKKTIYGRE